LALEPVGCWTTQVGPHHRLRRAPDRPYFSMRSHSVPNCATECTSSHEVAFFDGTRLGRKWITVRSYGTQLPTSKAVWANLRGVVLVDIDNFGMQAFRQSVCHSSLIGRCRYISSAARTKATHSICEDYVSWITSANQFLAYLSQRFLLLYIRHLLCLIDRCRETPKALERNSPWNM
jgi:hypothetical protein